MLAAIVALSASLTAVVGAAATAGAATTTLTSDTGVGVGVGVGYQLAGADGTVYAMGGSPYDGSLTGLHLSAPIVAAADTPSGDGYWLAGADGGVFSFGDAGFYGSVPSLPATEQPGLPVVSLVPTADGLGYWEVTSGGDVYGFGDATFYGSTGAMDLARPVVAAAVTPDGGGYWLVASDGGAFAFGDAGYFGSVAGLPAGERPSQPVVALVPTADGQGYWEVTSAGGVYSFGDAPFLGSTGGLTLPAPVVAAAATPDGGGYWLVGADGQVYPFGDAPADGSLPAAPPAPIVAIVPTPALAGVDAAPPPPSATNLVVTTTALPSATEGTAYSAGLSAAGGTAPYTWSVAGGSLPPGLSLSASGQLAGDPTATGEFPFTAEVTDSTSPTPLTATTTLTIMVQSSASSLEVSQNWAGYVDQGGPYTGVSGTFTVPGLTAGEVGFDAEWVGIGGFDDPQAPIQAGVVEGEDGDQSATAAWWETPGSDGLQTIDPGAFPVQAGDQVTVDISQLDGDQWSIVLTDDTTGQVFTQDTTYSASTDAAEWIVEAPVLDDPGVYVGEMPLAGFSPAVTFSQLGATGPVTSQIPVAMQDPVNGENGLSYEGDATPSALDPTGFAVGYGDTPPSAP